MSNQPDHEVRPLGRDLTYAPISQLRGKPTSSPASLQPETDASAGPGRRAVLAALALAPAALLGQQSLAAAPDLDPAVIAKASQVRTLLAEADAIGAAWSERHTIHARAIDALGPKPQLDSDRLKDLAGDVLVAFGELTEDVHAAVLQLRRALEARIEREAAAWTAEHDAIAARVGIREMDERDAAARDAADRAVLELAAMPATSAQGIVAKSAIFQPPFAPFNDENFVHLELAGSILRDLGRQAPRAVETAVLGGAAVGAATMPDALLAMWSEVRVIQARAPHLSEEGFDKGMDRIFELDRQVCSGARPTTIPGAIASLEWARSELVEHYLDGDGDAGKRVVLSLMDGALDVLRRTA